MRRERPLCNGHFGRGFGRTWVPPKWCPEADPDGSPPSHIGPLGANISHLARTTEKHRCAFDSSGGVRVPNRGTTSQLNNPGTDPAPEQPLYGGKKLPSLGGVGKTTGVPTQATNAGVEARPQARCRGSKKAGQATATSSMARAAGAWLCVCVCALGEASSRRPFSAVDHEGSPTPGARPRGRQMDDLHNTPEGVKRQAFRGELTSFDARPVLGRTSYAVPRYMQIASVPANNHVKDGLLAQEVIPGTKSYKNMSRHGGADASVSKGISADQILGSGARAHGWGGQEGCQEIQACVRWSMPLHPQSDTTHGLQMRSSCTHFPETDAGRSGGSASQAHSHIQLQAVSAVSECEIPKSRRGRSWRALRGSGRRAHTVCLSIRCLARGSRR